MRRLLFAVVFANVSIGCTASSDGVFDEQALARYTPDDRAYVMGHAMGVYLYGQTLPTYVEGTGYRYIPGKSSQDARVAYDYSTIILSGPGGANCDCSGGDCVGDCGGGDGGGDGDGGGTPPPENCGGEFCDDGGGDGDGDGDGDGGGDSPPPIDDDCETFLDPAAMDARERGGRIDVVATIGSLDGAKFQLGLADALALEDLGDDTDYSEPEHMKEYVQDYGLCEHSPLVLDLAGDGIAASAPEVRFDLKSSGVAFLVAWPKADDAFLAMDRDGDGRITSGAELFGNVDAPNGFESLAKLDDNLDGTIDARDAAFTRLVLWRDANRDGTSDGELVPLAAEGIVSIPITYTTSDARDPFGNALAQHGEFTRANGRGTMIDVWLRLRR